MGIISRWLRGEPEVEVSASLTSFKRLSVVGESFYQPALLAACGGKPGEEVSYECFAELVPEPTNEKDPNAVMVCIEGRQVGYLSRQDAAEWQPKLLELQASGQPLFCHAFIGCVGAARGNPNLGVSLKFPIRYE